MTLDQLIENSVLADFANEPVLAAWSPRPHDYDGPAAGAGTEEDPERPIRIAVTAEDEGAATKFAGIRNVRVEVEVNANALGEDVTAELLDTIAEKASDRLQPSTFAGVGREDIFSTPALKVYGIDAATPNTRSERDLTRTRIIARVFIAAQIS